MSSVPDCAWVRGYVLNKLQDGPVRVADLIRLAEAEFGFSPAEIHAAGEHFAVIDEHRDGELYWVRPANCSRFGGGCSETIRRESRPVRPPGRLLHRR